MCIWIHVGIRTKRLSHWQKIYIRNPEPYILRFHCTRFNEKMNKQQQKIKRKILCFLRHFPTPFHRMHLNQFKRNFHAILLLYRVLCWFYFQKRFSSISCCLLYVVHFYDTLCIHPSLCTSAYEYFSIANVSLFFFFAKC